jgi:hypothetical protein
LSIIKYIQQGCHFRRFLGKSRPKDVCQTLPHICTSAATVRQQDDHSTRWWALVDDMADDHFDCQVEQQTACRSTNVRGVLGRPTRLHPTDFQTSDNPNIRGIFKKYSENMSSMSGLYWTYWTGLPTRPLGPLDSLWTPSMTTLS